VGDFVFDSVATGCGVVDPDFVAGTHCHVYRFDHHYHCADDRSLGYPVDLLFDHSLVNVIAVCRFVEIGSDYRGHVIAEVGRTHVDQGLVEVEMGVLPSEHSILAMQLPTDLAVCLVVPSAVPAEEWPVRLVRLVQP